MKLTCPDVRAYQELGNGELPAERAEPLLEHLEDCEECAEKLQTMQFADTIAEDMRRHANDLDRPETPAVQELIERLTSATATFCGATSADDGDDLTQLGSFRLIRRLGRGGMGVVYEAEDVQLGRRVAVKLMHAAAQARPSERDRFLQEARAAAAVKHDHIVSIYQVGEDGGVPFLAMELLEGESLDDRLARSPAPNAAEVVHCGRQIALGLQAAHEKGLVHRDIKPSNIWIDSHTGRIKILDFGLAHSEAALGDSNQKKEVVGTPGYMAPEQARGERVDFRCDLFNLGCILYRMCTGRLPFRGDSPAARLRAVQSEQPEPVERLKPGLSPALSALIMQLLAKNPAERPSSARQVADTLSKIAVGKPRKSRWLLTATAAGFLLAVGLLCQQIIIRITDKDGNVKEIKTDGRVEVVAPKPQDVKVTIVPKTPEKSVFNSFQREQLSNAELAEAGGGDAVNAPAELVGVLQGLHTTTVGALALHPDGTHLISAAEDGKIGVWDLKERKMVAEYAANAQKRSVTSVSFSKSGHRLALMWKAGPAVFETGEATALFGRPIRHMTNFEASSVALSPDGERVAASSLLGFANVWSTESTQPLYSLIGHETGLYRVAFSADGARIATSSAGDNASVKVWETNGGKLLHSFYGPTQHGIIDVAFSPKGDSLAATQHTRILIWNPANGKDIATFNAESASLTALAYSPESTHIAASATGGGKGKVFVCHARSGTSVREWDAPTAVGSIMFAPDGRHLLYGTAIGTIYVIRLKNL